MIDDNKPPTFSSSVPTSLSSLSSDIQDIDHCIAVYKAQLEQSDMEVVIAGTRNGILMVEGEANEISEDEMVEAMQLAHEEIKRHCQAQIELTKMVGKEKKREYSHEKSDTALFDKMKADTYDKLYVPRR